MDRGQNPATVPYIGSKISLISNVDIRYEGVLYSINTFESTVALQNVRSLGTEGRRTPEVPANNKTYQFIIFKGKDIKDLTVCEPATSSMPQDPAVVSVNVAPSTPSAPMLGGGPQNHMQSPPMAQRQMMGQEGPHGGPGGYGQQGGNRMNFGINGPSGRGGNGFNSGLQHGTGRMPQYPQQGHSPTNNSMQMVRGQSGFGYGGGGRGAEMGGYQQMRNSMGPMMGHEENMMPGGMPRGGRFGGGGGRGGRGGRGGGGGSRRVVGQLPPQPNQAMKKEVSTAFDFETSNAKFDKTEINKQADTETATTTTTEKTESTGDAASTTTTPTLTVARPGYDKVASFFDNISCETLDRQNGQEARVDREKQKQLDCETFGAAAAAPRGRTFRRGFRRGGGGGGRRGGGGDTGGFSGYRGQQQGGRYVPVNNYTGGNYPGGNYGGGMRF